LASKKFGAPSNRSSGVNLILTRKWQEMAFGEELMLAPSWQRYHRGA
jgi:hypothetical protein